MKLSRENVNERDLILFGQNYDEKRYPGGIRRFDGLGFANLRKLFDINVIDPEDAQDSAPTAGEILGFLKDHPSFTAHGYAVSPERGDYRVSIEGVNGGDSHSMQDVWDFAAMFRWADDFSIDEEGMYCWYD